MEHKTDLKIINAGSLCVMQTENCDVWVYDKDAGKVILHAYSTEAYTVEKLSAFALRMLSEAKGLPLAIWTLQ